MDFLPHDLITEILSWLPVKSLLRFKTVCKLWRDTIQKQDFTHLHLWRSSLTYHEMKWEVYTLKPDSNDSTESFTYVSSFNGILVERCSSTNKYRIRNPSTKHVLHLPSPKHIESAITLMRFVFVFVFKTKEYKLVCYHLDKTTKRSGFEVLTLVGANSTWRSLDHPTNLIYAYHGKVGCHHIDDVFYILGRSMAGDVGVICLDLATEQLKEVAIPFYLFPHWRKASVSEWNGKFSVTSVVQEQIHAWILEDYKRCKWGDQKIGIPPIILKDHPQFREYWIRYIKGNKFVFSDKARNMFAYDIKCGKYLLSAQALGNKYRVRYKPSIVHFRGMQPE